VRQGDLIPNTSGLFQTNTNWDRGLTTAEEPGIMVRLLGDGPRKLLTYVPSKVLRVRGGRTRHEQAGAGAWLELAAACLRAGATSASAALALSLMPRCFPEVRFKLVWVYTATRLTGPILSLSAPQGRHTHSVHSVHSVHSGVTGNGTSSRSATHTSSSPDQPSTSEARGCCLHGNLAPTARAYAIPSLSSATACPLRCARPVHDEHAASTHHQQRKRDGPVETVTRRATGMLGTCCWLAGNCCPVITADITHQVFFHVVC
jgi:hypothetical protein